MSRRDKQFRLSIAMDDLIKFGASFIDERDYAQAEKFLRQAHKIDPNNGDAIDYLALALTRQSKLEEALALHELAVRMSNERNPRYLLNLGCCFEASGRNAEAEIALSKAHALDPDNVDILLRLGIVYADSNVPVLAEELLKKALKQKPHDGVILLTLARIEETKGNFAKEVDYLRKFISTKPRQEHADDIDRMIEKMLIVIEEKIQQSLELGNTYLDAGRFKDAESVYRKAIQRLGKHPDLLNDLGVALNEQKRYPEAVKCFRQAVKLKSRALFWSNLAINLQLSGKSSAAVEAFEEAVRLQQNYIPALWLSGRLFIELGNYERAEQVLNSALEIDECHPDANFQFSFVEQHKGNVPGALKALEKAHSHSSNPGFKLTIENRITELKAAPISRFQADDERNLWSIAQRLCGDRSFATELHKLNRDKFVWISQDGSVGYYGLKDCFEESDLQLPEKALAATVRATCGRFHPNSIMTPEEIANN